MMDFDERVVRSVPSDPEPTYEYRVVCAAEVTPPVAVRDYAHAVAVAEGFTSGGTHDHTIQRRVIGPWEAT